MGIGEMNFQAIWKNFGRYFGQTILHPQFLINRAAAMHRQRTRQLLKGRILDVGSGDSTSLKGLPEITGYITLDFPPTNARYLQRPDVFGDARHLPFPDASFEQIFLLEVLEHIPEPSHVPREIKRCLKQGGLLFLSTPCLYPLHDEPHDFQRFTRHGLRCCSLGRSGSGLKRKSSPVFSDSWLSAAISSACIRCRPQLNPMHTTACSGCCP